MRTARIIFSFLIAVSVIGQAHAASTPPCVKELKRIEKSMNSADRKLSSAEKKLFRMESATLKAEVKMEAKLLKYRLNEEGFKQARLFFVGSCALMLLFPKQMCTEIPQFRTAVYEGPDGQPVMVQEEGRPIRQCAESQQSCFAKVIYNEGKLMSLGAQRKAAEKSEQRKVDSVKKREAKAQVEVTEKQATYNTAKALYESKSALCQG